MTEQRERQLLSEVPAISSSNSTTAWPRTEMEEGSRYDFDPNEGPVTVEDHLIVLETAAMSFDDDILT